MSWQPMTSPLVNMDTDKVNAQLTFALDRASTKMLGKTAKAAKACADATFQLSQVYCPIDTGELRRSAVQEKVGPYQWKITYGNEVAWYAVRVHEISTFHHNPPTRWKYLEMTIEDLSNGHSEEFGIIMPYSEIFQRVYNGEELEQMFSLDVSDEPIPD